MLVLFKRVGLRRALLSLLLSGCALFLLLISQLEAPKPELQPPPEHHLQKLTNLTNETNETTTIAPLSVIVVGQGGDTTEPSRVKTQSKDVASVCVFYFAP